VLFLATESQGIFPSPAWLKVRGGEEPGGVASQATLVPATPGWEICGLSLPRGAFASTQHKRRRCLACCMHKAPASRTHSMRFATNRPADQIGAPVPPLRQAYRA